MSQQGWLVSSGVNKVYSGFLVDWTINSGEKHDSNDSVVASG